VVDRLVRPSPSVGGVSDGNTIVELNSVTINQTDPEAQAHSDRFVASSVSTKPPMAFKPSADA
jgi:hypothetical protein